MDARRITLAGIAALAVACTNDIVRPGQSGAGPLTLPQPGIVLSPAAPMVGEPVTFSSEEFGGAGARAWTFGDGSSDSGTVVVHRYEAAGLYDVTLAFDDGTSAVAWVRVSDRGAADPEQLRLSEQRAGRIRTDRR